MDFIHSREHLDAGDSVVLNCDTQCNFTLMDDVNFSSFKSGQGHEYYGGFFERFPARVTAPRSGYWNIVLDLAGGSANIRYKFTIIRA